MVPPEGIALKNMASRPLVPLPHSSSASVLFLSGLRLVSIDLWGKEASLGPVAGGWLIKVCLPHRGQD